MEKIIMPTCSKGEIVKTAKGKVTLLWHDVAIKTMDLDGESASDKWDNCHCKEDEEYNEIKCISADIPEIGKELKGTAALPHGIEIKYDLTIDTTRKITNCEYECHPKEGPC
jgi:hypothetical protein